MNFMLIRLIIQIRNAIKKRVAPRYLTNKKDALFRCKI
tara:strand:- start:250 stop:363 length:114 start_codon:yes stop_codon:yes gene_type:complete